MILLHFHQRVTCKLKTKDITARGNEQPRHFWGLCLSGSFPSEVGDDRQDRCQDAQRSSRSGSPDSSQVLQSEELGIYLIVTSSGALWTKRDVASRWLEVRRHIAHKILGLTACSGKDLLQHSRPHFVVPICWPRPVLLSPHTRSTVAMVCIDVFGFSVTTLH